MTIKYQRPRLKTHLTCKLVFDERIIQSVEVQLLGHRIFDLFDIVRSKRTKYQRNKNSHTALIHDIVKLTTEENCIAIKVILKFMQATSIYLMLCNNSFPVPSHLPTQMQLDSHKFSTMALIRTEPYSSTANELDRYNGKFSNNKKNSY